MKQFRISSNLTTTANCKVLLLSPSPFPLPSSLPFSPSLSFTLFFLSLSSVTVKKKCCYQ